MTRRTTVIYPSTQIDALYTLPNQPFKRRIISASLYDFDGNGDPATPEAKIADVEGNVLISIWATLDWTQTISFAGKINFLFAALGGAAWNLNQPTRNGSGAPYSSLPLYFPVTIPEDLCVPASNLFTITLWGTSANTMTIPNLVLVTEDDDDDDYRA
jgi:hypothetical protein